MLRTILAMVLLLAMVATATAQHAHTPDGYFVPKPIYFEGYVPFDPGEIGDGQLKFSVSQGIKVYDLWDQLDIHGVFGLKSVGAVNEESAPFTASFEPEFYARRTVGDHASLDYGWWHESNGMTGDASRSWDRQFVRLNVTKKIGGSVLVDLHPYIFEAFIVAPENPELVGEDGLRTFKGNYGFGGWGTVQINDDAIVWLDVAENKLEVALGLNTAQSGDKRWYTMLMYWNGTGDVILNHDAWSEAFGLGLMYAN